MDAAAVDAALEDAVKLTNYINSYHLLIFLLQMLLFTFLDNQDVFNKFYTNFLAMRLLKRSSASEEIESAMITKLKDRCGTEYTTKLGKMTAGESLTYQWIVLEY